MAGKYFNIQSRAASFPAPGIVAALLSALFLGLAPVFGRQAILIGLAPIAVVAIRTALAAFLLLAVMLFFYRSYLYIYPAGLLGCFMAGWVNGLGSLFYYSALGRIDASLGQLLYAVYPLFLMLWLALDHQPPSRLTVFRFLLALPGAYLLIHTNQVAIDMLGVVEMLIASALYALHLPINQRVLYDMPAPTVTLYTLLAMCAVVIPAFLFSGHILSPAISQTIPEMAPVFSDGVINIFLQASWPLIGLSLVTFFSRLMLSLGVKHLGGLQTALLGLSELLVTVFFAHILLSETFTLQQWIGAIFLCTSLFLIAFEKPPPKTRPGGFLSWLRPPGQSPEAWQPHD